MGVTPLSLLPAGGWHSQGCKERISSAESSPALYNDPYAWVSLLYGLFIYSALCHYYFETFFGRLCCHSKNVQNSTMLSIDNHQLTYKHNCQTFNWNTQKVQTSAKPEICQYVCKTCSQRSANSNHWPSLHMCRTWIMSICVVVLKLISKYFIFKCYLGP